MGWESFVLLNRGVSDRCRALGTRAGSTLVMLLLLSLGSSASQLRAESGAGAPPSSSSHLLFLPVVARPAQANEFPNNQAIWPHTEKPAAHEVALFRHSFSLAQPLADASLLIFADTRYEVWIDGQWHGRGPARFSRTRHEYDRHELGALPAGEHLIAVLVQWSPNARRAESVTPHLMAHIQGQTPAGLAVVARTSSQWQTKLSPAWRKDATPVHLWNLLGATEIVDLRQLPPDWTQPTFAAQDWNQAAVKNLGRGIEYLPRSIPHLTQIPFAPSVLDAGFLSPDRLLGQVTGATSWNFTVTQPITVTVEMLAEPHPQLAAADATTGRLPFSLLDALMDPTVAPAAAPASAPSSALLDGQPLTWTPAGPQRPDVQLAQLGLAPGTHTLQFDQPPATGAPFAISAGGVQGQLPFAPSKHAGRRLLLAEPVSSPPSVLSGHATSEGSLRFQVDRAPAYVVLDLGRVVHGRVVATVQGPAGTIVDIGWDERLLADTNRPLPHPGSLHAEWNQVDSWTLDGARRSITTVDARAGRYLLIAVWGSAPVEFSELRVLEERYPVQQLGWFTSSNGKLNAIWQLGVDTAYGSMQDAYADPWRERGQWWGDAYVTDHINQVAFGDTALLRRGLIFMGASFQNGQPLAFAPNGDGSQLLDYSMLWAQSLYDYLTRSEDHTLVASLYPTLQALMTHLASLRNPSTGLMDVPVGHWSQTALVDWAGVDSRNGQSAALNALYYGTLLDAAALAESLGDTAQADAWRATAATLRADINHHLFLIDPRYYAYAATILNGKLSEPTSHAQAWPLAFGVTPPDRLPLATEALLDDVRVEIFGMFWTLEGLYQAGRTDAALRLIEKEYGRLLDSGATTLWESWRSDQYYPSALSHSWGGAPTWFLTTRVLGLQRIGVNRWRVQPTFAGLNEVAGAIPLNNSVVEVQWQHERCQRTQMTVIAPTGTNGEVRLPRAAAIELQLEGQRIWIHDEPPSGIVRLEGTEIVVTLAEGTHHLDLRIDC
jgi:alpha-L-rhamnosidase